MNTKHIVFLAHDPGGFDVTNPVYHRLLEHNYKAEFFCIGPAASLKKEHAVSETEFLDKLNADLIEGNILVLVTGTSWGTDLELRAIRKCQTANVPTVALLDYWSNYRMRLSDSAKTIVFPDYYVVMDELAKKEAVMEGVPESIIHILGHPGLDRYVDYRGISNKAISGFYKVLYLSQPLSQLYGDSWGYTEESVLRDLIAVSEQIPFQLHIKFHPKDSDIYQRRYEQLSVIGTLIELMPQYDLVIGMNSMALLHAVIMGVPAISYQPQLQKPDVCITTKLGLTPLIKDYSMLVQYLKQASGEEANNNEAVTNGNYLWFDGNSTERVALFVEDVIQNGKN